MKKLLLSSSFILLSCLVFAGSNEWVKKSAVGGSKRERGVGFAIGNRGYIGLGQDTANLMLRDFWEYDPSTDTWTQKATFPGVARRDAIGFAIGTKGYVGTGMDNADAFIGNPLSDFYEYNPITNTWTPRAPIPGNAIYFATGFAVSGKGYVCCGKIAASFYSQQLWEYNPTTNFWTSRAPYPGGVRYGLSSFSIGNYGYVGIGLDENFFVQDFWKYNPAINSWTQISNFPSSARYSASTFSIGSRGFVVCGTDGGYKRDLYEYDATFNQWIQRADLPGSNRRSASSFALFGKGYLGTGKGADGTHRDFYEYTTADLMDVSEVDVNNSLNIFPNPMTSSCTIEIDNSISFNKGEIIISDVCGKLIRKINVETNSVKIEKENLSKGIYILQFVSENQIKGNARLIVE